MANNLNVIDQKHVLSRYFLLTYLVVLITAIDSVAFSAAYADGFVTSAFILITFLCYAFYFLLPAILITFAVRYLSSLRRPQDAPASAKLTSGLTYSVAILTGGLTTLLLYANAKIFSLYGMFINGFIINLLITPGGIDSLGGSNASDIGFMLIAVGFFALQAILLWLAGAFNSYGRINRVIGLLPRLKFLFVIISIALASIVVHLGYAISEATGKTSLTSLAETIPFFQPITSRHFFAKFGYQTKRGPKLDVKGHLHYPLKPINFEKPAKPYNIVWLTSESWRADMLDPEIMPSTWRFASQANRFTHNYSGGNGTRMGVFSMFTGIPGNYWFMFLKEQRGAALIDVLQKQNYQMSLYTSALFSYPEFEKTIFSQVPTGLLHSLQESGGPGWQRDRTNVTRMLEFIDKRDTSRPFFTFMFFESPHARYFFPPESVIRQPYRDDINYATLSKRQLRDDIIPIKNRYINSVHHLDSQFDRVFSYLKDKGLLDSTIIVVVGDHGEEFMEHGYWGHNSTFVDQQILTPLVIWVPSKAAKIHNEMSSHMDIPATIMPLLGVTNPASDYSIGNDLFSDSQRAYTYSSDWNRITYIDDKIKSTMNIHGAASNQITAADDTPLSPAQAVENIRGKQGVMRQVMHDISKFLEKNH